MEKIVTGPIGCIAGPWKACSTKRSLGNFPILGSGEKGSPMLHLDHPFDPLPAHDLYRILIRQVVASLDRIKSMIFPENLLRGQERFPGRH